MIDIVIPTMMKAPLDCLSYSLEQAIGNSFINNIHIIDNSLGLFQKNIDIKSNKLIVHEMTTNIYVNPAWNLGVSLCEAPFVIIMNDDVYVNGLVYNYINQLMKDDSIGLSSVQTINLSDIKSYLQTVNSFNDILTTNEIFGYNKKGANMSGWFFCIQKKIWKNIPEKMKIFFGDNLIYERTRKLGYKTKNIINVNIAHIPHSTINKGELLRHDKRWYRRNKEFYLKD